MLAASATSGMSGGEVATIFLVSATIGGLVGALIGRSKGRIGLGLALGLFLGWIGWIIIGFMKPTPEAQARRVGGYRGGGYGGGGGGGYGGAPQPQGPQYGSGYVPGRYPQSAGYASAPGRIPAGWNSDPTGRHEMRYWDGNDWTHNVSDRGVQGTDPV